MSAGDAVLLRGGQDRATRHDKSRDTKPVTMTGHSYPSSIEIVRTSQRFAEIAPEWDELAEPLANPLALHAWYAAALSATDDADRILRAVLIWRGNKLVAAAPLMLVRGSGATRLSPVDAFLGEPDRLLFADKEALSLLGAACGEQGVPVEFRRLSLPEEDLELFAKALRKGALVYCKQRHSTSHVDLPGGFVDLEASMSKQRRATVRRKLRKAIRDQGSAETELFAPEPAEISGLLERIEKLEESGWKGRAGTSLSRDQKLGNFMRKLATDFANSGKLRVSILTIGGKDAACRLMLEHANQWFEIKIGYDEAFRQYSPGITLMHETLRHACERGIERYHFLGLFEGWHTHWPHVIVEDCRFAHYPFNLSGVAALVSDCLQAAKSVARKVRGS